MYCKHCGSALQPSARFCPGCGAAVGEAPAPKKKTRFPVIPIVLLALVLLAAGSVGGYFLYRHFSAPVSAEPEKSDTRWSEEQLDAYLIRLATEVVETGAEAADSDMLKQLTDSPEVIAWAKRFQTGAPVSAEIFYDCTGLLPEYDADENAGADEFAIFAQSIVNRYGSSMLAASSCVRRLTAMQLPAAYDVPKRFRQTAGVYLDCGSCAWAVSFRVNASGLLVYNMIPVPEYTAEDARAMRACAEHRLYRGEALEDLLQESPGAFARPTRQASDAETLCARMVDAVAGRCGSAASLSEELMGYAVRFSQYSGDQIQSVERFTVACSGRWLSTIPQMFLGNYIGTNALAFGSAMSVGEIIPEPADYAGDCLYLVRLEGDIAVLVCEYSDGAGHVTAEAYPAISVRAEDWDTFLDMTGQLEFPDVTG